MKLYIFSKLCVKSGSQKEVDVILIFHYSGQI